MSINMASDLSHEALQADLEAALNAEPGNKNYYIRQALQRLVDEESVESDE